MNLMNEALKDVASAERAAREAFVGSTLSLDLQVGLRFCPAKGLAHLLSTVDDAKRAFDAAARAFVAGFQANLDEAKRQWAGVVEQQTGLPEHAREAMLHHGYERMPHVAPALAEFRMDMLSVELAVPGQPSLADLDASAAAAAQEAAENVRRSTQARLTQVADGFVQHCRREIFERMSAFFSGLRELVKADKPINKRTVVRINKFIATIRRLDFTGDAGIASVLDRFQAACFPGGVPAEGAESGISDAEDLARVAVAVRDIGTSLDDIASMLSFASQIEDTDMGGVSGVSREPAAPAGRRVALELDGIIL